jgi:sialate O-acetylesterase
MIKRFFFSALFFVFALAAFADVRLPAIIGDHMVLQQSTTVTLWGWCDPGEKVSVRTGWDTATYVATGTAGATWQLSLPTPKAGGPFTITIKANNTITLDDVLVGEVWLCSGQSNMEMNMGWGLPYEKEASEATDKRIRFFGVPRTTSFYPQDDVKAKWVVCTPEEMKKFSAVGYFFGKDVAEKLNLPVGLISASWGGTPAEAWTPDSIVRNNPALQIAANKLKPSNGWPVQPGATYNAMIYPLQNFALAGALWYQGESNVGTWDTYRPLLVQMIDAWRRDFQKEFPFYLVQIAPFAGYGAYPSSALLREEQAKVASHFNTGMVVIHDLVDNINDIHPKMKKEVGQRLAALALSKTYGMSGLPADYPKYGGMAIEKNKIRITFANAEGGLMAKGGELKDFYIAGEDKVFYPAKAAIRGSSVVVGSNAVKKPVAVRFGFSNAAMPNLFNKEGLPVAIFRTDNWEVTNNTAK